MNVLLAVAAIVGTIAALTTVWFASRTVRRADKTIELMGTQLEAARAAHAELLSEQRAAFEQDRQARADEIAQAEVSLAEEQHLARLRQTDRVAEILDVLARVLTEEESLRPDGKLTHINLPTHIPTIRQRLKTALAGLTLVGGPPLAACWQVAEGSEFGTDHRLRGAIYNAMHEVASSLYGEVPTESQPGGRLASRAAEQ